MHQIVVASHGTRDPRGRRAVASLAAALRDVVGPVEESFVDVQEPSLDAVLDAGDGRWDTRRVVPLLLSAGFHTRVDVARAADRPGVTVAGPMGPDPRLVDVLVDRLAEVDATPADQVVLGAAGTRDPSGRAHLALTARRLSRAWGAPVPVGVLGGTGERLADVVARVRRPGRRVVVADYLLAPGYFDDLMREAGADRVTAPLLDDRTPDRRILGLVADRCAVPAALAAAR